MSTYQLFVIYVFSFIFGTCTGSAYLCFLDRKKRHESWLHGHSHCNACGHELAGKDLIPVISYISLKGKCRYCKAHYPISSLLSEVVSGCAFLFAAFRLNYNISTGDTAKGIAQALIFILLALASVNDIYCHECEYYTQFSVLGIGAIYALFFGTETQLLAGVICVASLTLLNFLYCKIRKVDSAIGFADIVVLSGVACALTPLAVPLMVLCTCIISLVSLPIVTQNQKQQGSTEAELGVGLLPFIVFGAEIAEFIAQMYLAALFL